MRKWNAPMLAGSLVALAFPVHAEEAQPATPPPSPAPAAPAPSVLPEMSAAQPLPPEVAAQPAPAVPAPVAIPVLPAPTDGPKIGLGLQAFLRGEARLNPAFDESALVDSSQTILERIRLTGHGSYGPVKVLAQIQDARTWGFEQSTSSNEGNVDLHQGYLEVGGGKEGEGIAGWLRGGRQEISYGNQRLIGAFGWSPAARSFDALRGRLSYNNVWADGFLAALAPQQLVQTFDTTVYPNKLKGEVQSEGSWLRAVQLGANLHPAFNAEFLLLSLHARATPAAPATADDIANFGLRMHGKPVEGLAYDIEGNLQTGERGVDTPAAMDHKAWAAAATVGYTLGKSIKPGLSVGAALASGNDCSGGPTTGGCKNTESNEFYNFFPTNHIHYGSMDFFGWRNMRDIELKAFATPLTDLRVTLAYHNFALVESSGRWSNAAGTNVGRGWDETNTETDLGHEIDLTVDAQPWKALSIQPGYGVFIPTGAGEVLGGPDAQHFFWLWIQGSIDVVGG